MPNVSVGKTSFKVGAGWTGEFPGPAFSFWFFSWENRNPEFPYMRYNQFMPTECELWTGCMTRDHYGQLHVPGYRTVGAHVAAYAFAHGMHPRELAGSFIRHSCDNPTCVNPDHLIRGTHRENMADMVVRGRSRGGRPRVYGPVRQLPAPEPTGRRGRPCGPVRLPIGRG